MSHTLPDIRLADWSDDEAAIRRVRGAVFTGEQGIAEELEFDGLDPGCVHVLAYRGGEAVGTGRMQTDGHIGRVAVVREHRRRGVGGAVVRALVAYAADHGIGRVRVHSQVHAAPFYEKLGFRRDGAPFLEAGIEHCSMARASEPADGAENDVHRRER